jgi:hypothetical protein
MKPVMKQEVTILTAGKTMFFKRTKRAMKNYTSSTCRTKSTGKPHTRFKACMHFRHTV